MNEMWDNVYNFFWPKSPSEIMRENKRLIARAERNLQREIKELRTLEAKTTREIKPLVERGEMNNAKIMAKELVRVKKGITQLLTTCHRLNALSGNLSQLKSTNTVIESIKSITDGLKRITISPANIHEFERQMDKMEIQSEVLGNMIEMGVQEDGEEESDMVVTETLAKIMDEMRLQDTGSVKFPDVPTQVPQRNPPIDE